MNFIQVWFTGYINPVKFIDTLKSKPKPYWGFYAQIIRSLMISLLLYLPLALLRRVPSTPSYLTFIPTENYYSALIWLAPIILMTEWLLGAAVIHISLRMCKLPSDLDQILNLTGMANLLVAVVLLIWDWSWFLIGGVDQYFLGISHLLIDIWWFIIVVTGFKRLFKVPVSLGIVISLIAFIVGFPISMIFMRAPF